MSTADLFDDDWPYTHGTVDGYTKGGCRGGACPAGVEHGLSCKRAKQLADGDYRYKRLAREGKTPAEIAAALAEAPTTTSAAQPLAERANDTAPQEDAVDPAIEREAPAERTPAAEAEAMGHHPTPEETPAMPTPADAAKASKAPSTTPATPPSVDETIPYETDEGVVTAVDLDGTVHREQPAAAPLTTDRWTAGLTIREKTEKLREIREWCRANGFPGVPTRGKIPNDALAAYAEQHQVIIVEAEVVEAVIDEDLAALNRDADGEPDYADDLVTGAAGVAVTLEPAEFDEALTQARGRAGTVCKQCTAAKHPGCTGRVYSGRDEPRCDCDCPASRFLRGDQPVTAGAGPVLEDLPRPEWADVAIAVDVERARNIAVRLEQELAHVTEQLQQAHAAVETTLQKWASDTDRLQAENDRLLAEVGRLTVEAGIAVGTANLWADLYAQANAETARLRLHGEQTFAQELERFLTPTPPPTAPRRIPRSVRPFWKGTR